MFLNLRPAYCAVTEVLTKHKDFPYLGLERHPFTLNIVIYNKNVIML